MAVTSACGQVGWKPVNSFKPNGSIRLPSEITKLDHRDHPSEWYFQTMLLHKKRGIWIHNAIKCNYYSICSRRPQK